MIYELKNDFKILWGSAFLSYWADRRRTFKKKILTTLANSLDKHHQRIINVIDSKITNAILDRIQL